MAVHLDKIMTLKDYEDVKCQTMKLCLFVQQNKI